MAEIRFDAAVAPTYDADSADMFDPSLLAQTVDLLVELADGRPALELAVGTGRVALPLAARGVDVHGIELSPAMVEQLRAKPGGDEIPVTVGDMATTTLPARFGLVYLVYNTITNLLTQDEQVACFANAAAHLVPGGRFVVECYVPVLPTPGQPGVLFRSEGDRVGYDTFEGVDQRSYSHHWWDRGGGDGVARFSAPYRYVWPSELDLMARLAGLTLVARYGGWDRSPFTSRSASRVAVYQL